LRFFMLRTHYRSPFNFSDQALEETRTSLKRLYTALQLTGDSNDASPIDWAEPHCAAFKVAMDDDFNTPGAVAVLFELAADINRGQVSSGALLRALGGVLGLLQQSPSSFLQGDASALDTADIQARIDARSAAKASRDFGLADSIREQLLNEGIALKDGPQGTTWIRN
jgi:cysteinyl-tRNA synthetase